MSPNLRGLPSVQRGGGGAKLSVVVSEADLKLKVVTNWAR